MTIRLAVNLRPLVPNRIGGMEVYARSVIRELLRYDRASIEVITLFTSPRNDDAVQFDDPRVRRVLIPDDDPVERMLAVLASHGADALFCPLVSLEPRDPGIPSFVTIPDVQHEIYPHFFDPETLARLRDVYSVSVRLASRVFTISEFSSRGIVDAYGVDPAKIVVVPLAADDGFGQCHDAPEREVVRQRYGLPSRYVLYPAVTWPHKNHGALLRAVRTFNQKYEPLTVVLTGSAGPAHEAVRSDVEALGLAAHTRLLGHIPRTDLACLYRDALALVFPSLFEGFGLPILESFHAGCPVICSRMTSCPEVAGSAALYVDPRDPASIVDALERLEESEEERTRLVNAGREQAAKFSWHEAGRRTLATIRAIVEDTRRPIIVTEWPSMTVVTPTLNHAKFIGETIDSVLSQGYPNLEYIVVDGGSTDGTQEILRRYGHRLRWISERDDGQADAVNKGVVLGHGEIIGWLNSDDTYAAGALSAAARAFTEHRDAAVVYGRGDHVLEDGRLYGPYPTLPFDPLRLAETCFICQPAAFIRRTAFEEVGRLDATLRFCMDYDLWIRMARQHRFVYVPLVLARSRLHAEAKTLASRRAVIEEILATVKRHYGVVPFPWVSEYATYLFNRSPREMFTPRRSSYLAFGASVVLALWLNRDRPSYWRRPILRAARRVLRGRRTAAASEFCGRWGDGWVSKRYVTELAVDAGAATVVIRGRHVRPGRRPLMLSVLVNDAHLGTYVLFDRGPFTIQTPCPQASDGRVRLEIIADRTFRPIYRGLPDSRLLSCLIDDVSAV